jgi:30S ribosomal protein S31
MGFVKSAWASQPCLQCCCSLSLLFLVSSPPKAAAGTELCGMAMRLAAAAAFVRRLAPARPPVPVPAAASAAEAEAVTCGRGDKKTKRGKRFKGSYGNARPKREKKIERIKDRIEVPRSTPWPLPFKLI